jgi:hypothetical protein
MAIELKEATKRCHIASRPTLRIRACYRPKNGVEDSKDILLFFGLFCVCKRPAASRTNRESSGKIPLSLLPPTNPNGSAGL